MNVAFLGALVLSLNGASDAREVQGAWTGLDQEISNLAASLATEDGVKIGGFLRVRYSQSSDAAFAPDEGKVSGDLSGFNLTNARLTVDATVGDYKVRVQPDFGTSTILKDAYVQWPCGEALSVRMGNFKTPFSPRFLVSLSRLILLDFSAITQGPLKGVYFDRDVGLQLSGDVGERFDWTVAVQNGTDSRADEYLLTARGVVGVLGKGTTGYEGGYGMGDETALDIGVAYSEDGAIDDAEALTLDATLNANPFNAGFALFDFGEGVGNNTPWDVYFGYSFQGGEWEAALRYEDMDDEVADTTVLTVGVNKYLGRVDRKWQANVVSVDSDDPSVDGTLIAVGITMAF